MPEHVESLPLEALRQNLLDLEQCVNLPLCHFEVQVTAEVRHLASQISRVPNALILEHDFSASHGVADRLCIDLLTDARTVADMVLNDFHR